jgi:two-component system, chemotaxis family, chemotaxis protein CheY
MKQTAITVIDDDMSARSLLTSILRNLGYTDIRSLTDEDVAKSSLESIKPGIVFLDIEMPACNGFDLVPRLKLLHADIFIVMVSAHTTMDNVRKAMEFGAGAFIAKPYAIGKVHDVIEKYRVANAGVAVNPGSARKEGGFQEAG